MTRSNVELNPIRELEDNATPVAALLGVESRAILEALVSQVGGTLIDSKVVQVRYSPGAVCVVQYRVNVDWGRDQTSETFVASHGLETDGDVVQIEFDGLPISIWRYPQDPFLPGLVAASDPKRVANLLADLGAQKQQIRLRRRAYRPGRRAVIEAVAPKNRLFIKVVQPADVADLHARHRELAKILPVPNSHGWSEDQGLIALEAMGGRTFRKSLESGARRFPEPQLIVEMLDRFPSTGKRKRGPIENAAGHARLLKALVPDMSSEIDDIRESLSGATDVEPVGVHGDFHSAQLLVDGNRIVGLVDVDNAGLGQRADDYAGLIGQLSTSALVSARRKTINDYAEAALTTFERETDPVDLRLRIAAVVLGLSTGPFRVQRPTWPAQTRRRIGLARQWVDSAVHLRG